MKLNLREENLRRILAGACAALVIGTSIFGFSSCSKGEDDDTSIVLSVPRASFCDSNDYDDEIDKKMHRPNSKNLKFAYQINIADFDKDLNGEELKYLAINREGTFIEKFNLSIEKSAMNKAFFNVYNYFILPDCYSYIKEPNTVFDTTLTVKKFKALNSEDYYYWESVNVSKCDLSYVGLEFDKEDLNKGDTIIFKGLYGRDYINNGNFKLIGCIQTGAGSYCENVTSRISTSIDEDSLKLISGDNGLESGEFSNSGALEKYIYSKTKN